MSSANQLTLEIVTPERQVVIREVDSLVLPSVEGYMGVLPGHAPLLAQLGPGEISYRAVGREHYLAVSGGFAEVLPDKVGVLATTCEPAEEIDVERAKRAKENAEATMRERQSETDLDVAAAKLQVALARIRVHGRLQG